MPDLRLWLREDLLGEFCLLHAEVLLNQHGPLLEARFVDAPGGVSVVAQLCYLSIYAASEDVDFNPSQVTARLGVEPTRTQRRGAVGPGGRVCRWSKWAWELPRRFEGDTEVLVRELLDLVEPFADRLDALRADLPVCADVVLAQYLNGYVYDFEDGEPPSFTATTPALCFEAATLRRLAALGLGLDIDQHV